MRAPSTAFQGQRSKRRSIMALLLLGCFLAIPALAAGTRNVFLNGIDISSARSQELKNVTIHINENGDLFITAPHYQVNEEDTYIPLSKYVQGLSLPVHKKPLHVDKNLMKIKKETVGEDGQIEKPGDNPPKGESPPETKEDGN